MRSRDPRLFLLLGCTALAGCSTVCKGPSCADAYELGRLSLFDWSDGRPTTIDVWDDATWALEGVEADGTDWVVQPAGGQDVWIGMPQSNQVVRAAIDPESSRVVPKLTITGEGAFGYALARADIDDSGTRDLLVGAPEDAFSAGAVYVFLDPPASLAAPRTLKPDFVVRGKKASERLGESIITCADLTGDNVPEVAITSPRYDLGTDIDIRLPGAVTVMASERVPGLNNDVSTEAIGSTWWGDATGDGAGRAVACRNDLTGDRQPDIAIGAPDHGVGGAVYIIPAGAGIPEGSALGAVPEVIQVETAREDAWFGAALVPMELDGAAPMDLVIGAPGAHQGAGRVEIFHGSELDLELPEAWRVVRNGTSRGADHFGRTLAARDLDGDGVDDLMVGVPDWYGGGNAYDSGRVFIWSGSSSGVWPPAFTVSSRDWVVEGTQPFQRVGRRIETFDIDGDGALDLVLPTRGLTPD